MHLPSQPLTSSSSQFIDSLISERLSRVETDLKEHKENILPLLGGIEAMTQSINESLLDIKGDLKEVRGDVRLLSSGQQGIILDIQSLTTKVVTLETIEKDRKDRKRLIVKTVLGAVGTVAAAFVIWYLGWK